MIKVEEEEKGVLKVSQSYFSQESEKKMWIVPISYITGIFLGKVWKVKKYICR